ncbi:MAG: methyltransferase domain-containing protein [Anaerolineales bacterium]|nr:methyltransferase domain-containing protein [Anaerolineales bacterium]
MPPADLFDLLACPLCRIPLVRVNDGLLCNSCQIQYPILNGVPIIFPHGHVPSIAHQEELNVVSSYNPWVHRVILQSLFDHHIVLEIGSGNMALDDPNIIRMDVAYGPYVDVVGDAHALPFLPNSIDFIFSLAVFEHLRNPFEAAKSIFEVLRDGGFIYHECNFVFAYHGFPHHYFNASLQGMEQIFAQFRPLRKGVAPYQMPSFAVECLLGTYLHRTKAHAYPHGRRLVGLMRQILAEKLIPYDIYFTEEDALYVAAGTYFAGQKRLTPQSTLLPQDIRDVYFKDAKLQERFPDIDQLTTIHNLYIWAKTEGMQQYPQIADFLKSQSPFNKRGHSAAWDRSAIKSMELVEPLYGAIGFDPSKGLEENAAIAANCPPKPVAPQSLKTLIAKAIRVWRTKGKRAVIRKILYELAARI